MKPTTRALLAIPFLLAGLLAFGQSEKASVAFLGVTNRGGEPRYEYLAGIIQGILLYDLSAQKDIEIVDRVHLEDVLKEQELRMSAVIDDQSKALEVGKILGADYLLRADYVNLGEEIQINAALVAVGSAKTVTFAQRGATENTIHALSESIIQKLTGTTVTLRSPQRELSILSMQDETPGSIALYVGLIEAEIYLDGDFAGYSGDDTRTPFIIETVKPGPHTLSIKLPRFGVVSLPDFTFHDWQQTLDVKPGKRQVVRANAAQYNDIIYKAMSLASQDVTFDKLSAQPLKKTHDLSFTDRQGNKIASSLELSATRAADSVRVQGQLLYQGERHPFDLTAKADDKETTITAGKISLSVKIDVGWTEVSYSAQRTDIWQNMDMEDKP